MNEIILFIQDYYMIVTVIAVILLLSLIGYLVQHFSSRDITIKNNNSSSEESNNIMNTES